MHRGGEAMSSSGHLGGREATRLGELSREQWTSGLAAWLGWLFDGLDMHLYTLVAIPFVAELLGTDVRSAAVNWEPLDRAAALSRATAAAGAKAAARRSPCHFDSAR
jgi:hypothetical protein